MKNKKEGVLYGSYMYFGGILTAIFLLAIAVSIALIVMDIVLLTGENRTTSPIIVGVSLGIAIMILVGVLVFFINSRYVFTEDMITIKTFVFTDKVKYADIDGILQDEKTGVVYVHASPENKVPITFRLNLSEKNLGQAKDILLGKCDVGIETFTYEKKKK